MQNRSLGTGIMFLPAQKYAILGGKFPLQRVFDK